MAARVAPYLWPAGDRRTKARVLIALVCLVVAKIATVATPVFYKYAVDALEPKTAGGVALSVALGLTFAYAASRALAQGFAQARDFAFARVAQQAMRQIALNVFRHLHALSLRFHLDRQTGGLGRVIERGVNGVGFMLRMMLFSIIPVAIELIFIAVILGAAFDWRFVAVTFGVVAVYAAFTFAVTEYRIRLRRRMNAADERANTASVDALLNYETVKYFNAEAFESARFDAAMRQYESAARRISESLALLNAGQGVIIAVGLFALMAMAADGVAAGTMTVGDFVMVNAYLIQLHLPLNLFGMVYREIKQSIEDMTAMFALLDQPIEIADAPKAPALRLNGGRILFDDVRFSYDGRREILRGVSFEIPPGRTLAVVVASGAGKSTLARLLFRFYDVTGGRILIDGQDVRAVAQASLRRAIGVVPQDAVLFNETIGFNLLYGRPDADAAARDAAARDARIDGFVNSLPDGWSTRVGERGLKLSGGEKQRVAIARTLLKDPPILILDEATSALDSVTEQAIQDALRRLAEGRTTLVIAHRLSTIADADAIVVLDDGRVVERGDHAGLLARGGRYAALWARQQADAELGAPETTG